MRATLLAAALLVGCSSTTTVTVGPSSANDTDARICTAIQPQLWNDSLIGALAANPQTPIQEQTQAAHESWQGQDVGEGGFNAARDQLTQMCVDAGY